jgi:hypothetical protein
MTPRIRRLLWLATLVLWTVGVGGGLHTLWSYENAAGPSADAPARWPETSRLPRPDGRPVLILALHPQCPCSRATVAELARLVAHTAAPFAIEALVVAPPGFEEALIHSKLWDEATVIPGVHVVRDTGAEARRFGARVSGQVLAYDGAGRLQFNGGITGSRGHEGDNAGRAAVEALLAGRPHSLSSFVFGCLLFDGDGNAAPVEQGAI